MWFPSTTNEVRCALLRRRIEGQRLFRMVASPGVSGDICQQRERNVLLVDSTVNMWKSGGRTFHATGSFADGAEALLPSLGIAPHAGQRRADLAEGRAGVDGGQDRRNRVHARPRRA